MSSKPSDKLLIEIFYKAQCPPDGYRKSHDLLNGHEVVAIKTTFSIRPLRSPELPSLK